MDDLEFPIVKKMYVLYKELNDFRALVAKRDRYTIWERCEKNTLDVLELLMLAAQRHKRDKYAALEMASAKLNVLRILIRLAKDIKAIDTKRYLTLESQIDEVGRMLGGWMRSIIAPPPELEGLYQVKGHPAGCPLPS